MKDFITGAEIGAGPAKKTPIRADNEVRDRAARTDEDLLEQMHHDLYCGLREEVASGASDLLERGWSAERVLNDGLVEGMRKVGVNLQDGILSMPEMMLAADAMERGMEILRPALALSAVSDGVAKISLASWAVWPRELTTAIRSRVKCEK